MYLCAQVGTIIEALTARKGDLLEVASVAHGFGAAADSSSSSRMDSFADSSTSSSAGGAARQRLVFEVPARCMIGFKSLFAGVTRGEGVMQRSFSR